eukprot:COSAG06_NODE_8446_length_2171_cov_43.077220_2_plen_181_part_00
MSTQPQVAGEAYREFVNGVAARTIEAERVAAADEVARLKRKYEPDDGIIIDKLLKLTDDHACRYMRVLVRTGEYLLLELVADVRNNGNVSNWEFRPPIEGKRDNMQDFGSYGVYEVYIGDGAFGHTCLVHFDKAGVSITAIYEPEEEGEGLLVIQEFAQAGTPFPKNRVGRHVVGRQLLV